MLVRKWKRCCKNVHSLENINVFLPVSLVKLNRLTERLFEVFSYYLNEVFSSILQTHMILRLCILPSKGKWIALQESDKVIHVIATRVSY